jgi:hypothetical protein
MCNSTVGIFFADVDDTTLLPAVRAAALRGIVMMNKYYALTDDSSIYRVAMSKFGQSLHPNYEN